MAAKVLIGSRVPDAEDLAALELAFDRLSRALEGLPVERQPVPALERLTFEIPPNGKISIEVPPWLYDRFLVAWAGS